MKIGYRIIILVVVIFIGVVFFFKGRIFNTLISLDLSRGSAATENYRPTSRALTFRAEVKEKFDEIGKLNNEILTFSEKSKTASQDQKNQNISQLKTRLAARAAKIQLLLTESPDATLPVMLPPKTIVTITQQAPVEANKFLEKTTSVNNVTLKVIHVDHFNSNDLTKSTGEIEYYIIKNKSEQRLYLAGGEIELTSGTKVNIDGYELPSGNVLAASGAGSLRVISVPTPESVGNQKTLTILVNFADSGPVPFSKEQAQSLVFNGPTQNFYRENSYGKAWFTGDVAGWYNLPRNGHVNGSCQWPQPAFDDFSSLLQRDNINLATYGRVLFLANHPCMGGGFSSVGKVDQSIGDRVYKLSESWVGWLDFYNSLSYMPELPSEWRIIDFILTHELGHALGVVHANGWNCNTAVLYSDECRHQEYGNYYDTMGSGIYSLNFNAYFKDTLGWLKGKVVSVGDTRGKYRRYSLSPLESLSGFRGIRITMQGMTKPSYYVEYRTAIGYDSHLKTPNLDNTRGVFINWIPERGQWAPMSRLLDMTPGNYSLDNVVLAQDKEFTDYGRGVSIKLGTRAIRNNSASVMVKTFKPVCQNLSPSLDNFYSFNQSVHPGDSIFISFRLFSQDSPSCPKTSFKFDVLPPNGWSANISPESKFDLEAGAYNYGNTTVTIPQDAAGGNYGVTFRATKYKSDGITVDKITEMPFYIYVN